MTERAVTPVAVYIFIEQAGQVLLLKRHNTGYRDGEHSLPSGHKEVNETPLQAAVREVKEETGLTLKEDVLEFIHVMHRHEDREYIDFFYWCNEFNGEPTNAEPHKCSDVSWHSLANLPETLFEYVADVITFKNQGVYFSER